MESSKKYSGVHALGTTAILVHFGLVVIGITAVLSGLLADDYKKAVHWGFTVHSWIGMAGAAMVLLRLLLGVVGPCDLRFATWVPCTRERLAYVKEDLMSLGSGHLPPRPPHFGLAGLVQVYGLGAFLLVAASGTVLFFGIEPGQKAHGFVHGVKEVHEVGLFLIPSFLALHLGGVIMHAMRGRHAWRRMFFLNRPASGVLRTRE
jgi:cytochrome b